MQINGNGHGAFAKFLNVCKTETYAKCLFKK